MITKILLSLSHNTCSPLPSVGQNLKSISFELSGFFGYNLHTIRTRFHDYRVIIHKVSIH